MPSSKKATIDVGVWSGGETVCPCWRGRKLYRHLVDEDSPWPYALNPCRKTELLSPEGHDGYTERKRGRRGKGSVTDRDMSRERESMREKMDVEER